MDYRPKSSAEIHRNMSAIRSRDNKTEMALRLNLHHRGFRYRRERADLPGRPDFVFPKEKVAVFVDGDFWHGRILREQGPSALRSRIKKNHAYWIPKIQRNISRDQNAVERLQEDGWLVLRFWESDIIGNIPEAADKVAEAVSNRRRHHAGS